MWYYSATRWGEQQADLYLANLHFKLAEMIDRPERGRTLEGLPAHLRFVRSGRHFAFYRWNDDKLVVVRVLHDRMDPGRHLS